MKARSDAMTIDIDAVYENGVLKLKQPVDLPENAEVHVTIQTDSEAKTPLGRRLRELRAEIARSGMAPLDWDDPSINKDATNTPIPPTFFVYWWPPQSPEYTMVDARDMSTQTISGVSTGRTAPAYRIGVVGLGSVNVMDAKYHINPAGNYVDRAR
jgi:predicted DNA-binding antitoxin AbrB/MazE fold protein